jgi:CIC family chloride channel protein
LPPQARNIATVVVFGLMAGLVAVLFHLAIHAIYEHGILALSHGTKTQFLIGSFLIVAGTSAIAGWMLTQFCRDAAGSGIPQVKLAFWKDFGVIPWRVVWVKFIGGALSVGGGSSLGREGPSVQLASGLASSLSSALGTPKHMRRTAAAAGAAAGLAAAFNTPIAAVTFVLEEIIGDLNSRMLGSVLLASVLGALVAHGMLGSQPAFILHAPGVPHWLSYAITPVVAAAAAIAGCWFQKLALGIRAKNKKPSKLPAWSRTMLGGILAWALGAGVFLWTGHLGVFSLGYDDLSSALDGGMIWQLAALLLVAKLLATALCYGFGGCGGIFAPTLFFGGMTGAVISGLVGLAIPLSTADHVTLAVVGMCACLGAVVRAPVTGILIVFEMTHEFALVPALAIGALVSQWISRKFNHENFYEAVLSQDGNHVERIVPPRSLRTWMELPVARIANFSPVVSTDLSTPGLKKLLSEYKHERFPVVVDGRLKGVLTRKSAELALSSMGAPHIETPVVCTAESSLREVQSKLIESTGQLAVVLDHVGPEGRVVGLMTLHDILRAEMLFAKEQVE